MRPLLIYKYKKNKHKPEINFDQVLMQEERKNKNVAEYLYNQQSMISNN